MQAPPISYRLLTIPLFLFWIAHGIVHSIRYKCWHYLFFRLGFIPKHYLENTIWIHASSVGEVHLITPLCHSLKLQGHSIFVTTFTATGFQQAQTKLSNLANIAILPIDFMPISAYFAWRNQCKVALIAETELWPETLFQLAQKNTSLVQVNARFSAKSLNAKPWILNTLKTTLSYFKTHFTRTEDDKKKLLKMGVSDCKIKILGNLKNAIITQKSTQCFVDRPYVLFASTHENEELLFLNSISNLPKNTIAVIAPRHPNRGSAIKKLFSAQGIECAQRSKNEVIQESTLVYIADTLGEMPDWYAHATIVIMGGSFVPIGGHNVLEPAAYGAAIITGPSDDNIQQDIMFLNAHKAIIQVGSKLELETTIADLINHPQQLEKLSRQATKTMLQQNEVIDLYVNSIKQLLS